MPLFVHSATSFLLTIVLLAFSCSSRMDYGMSRKIKISDGFTLHNYTEINTHGII
jgi:hypothetical protein